MKYRIEKDNLDGRGMKAVRVFDMPVVNPGEYWPSVTDVPCPVCERGTVRWHEAGYVPGYRICQECKRHFLAGGTVKSPVLRRMGQRRGLP